LNWILEIYLTSKLFWRCSSMVGILHICTLSWRLEDFYFSNSDDTFVTKSFRSKIIRM